jgi:hypothetical protein
LLDPQTKREVIALLAYAEDAAGGLMSTRFVRLRSEMSVDEAISYLRIQAKTHVESIYYAYVLGCFEKATRHVKFAIVNSGLSIYETLASNESTSREVLTRIEKVLIDQRSFLTRTKDLAMRVSEEEIIEPIWNVMALQEGISSKRTEDSEGRTRGKGMMDVLDFISEIHQHHEDACIVIISGHSRILIDYEYPILRKKVVVDHENGPKTELWRAISFNKEGSLHLPQDPNKVGYIKSKFDGTIITGRFKLSDKYVKQIENLED